MLETEDLYLAAYALSCGGELRRVEVRNLNGRRLAFFHLEGHDVHEAELRYWRGDAVVNLQTFKFQLRRLKDRCFGAVRGEERNDAHAPSRRPGVAVAAEPHRRARR